MGLSAVLPGLRSSRPNISLLVAKVRFNRRMVFGRAKSTRVVVAATADSVLEDVVESLDENDVPLVMVMGWSILSWRWPKRRVVDERYDSF